jgi:hypothetical protein
LVFVLSVPFRFTAFDYLFGIFWSLYCLYLLDLRLLITPLVSFGLCIVCTFQIYDFWLPLWYLLVFVLSVPFRFTTFDYPFVLSVPFRFTTFDYPFVLSVPFRFTTFDYPFGIFWSLYCLYLLDLRLLITLWYLLVFVLSVPFRFTTFDYPFGIYWSLYCLYLLDLRLLISPLVSIGLCIVCTF